MDIRQIIIQDITDALLRLKESQGWRVALPLVTVEMPQQSDHGDFATTIALQLAKPLRTNPIDIAKTIVQELIGAYEAVTVAPPGFINFAVSADQLSAAVWTILKKNDSYGRANIGHRKKVLFEFISANPTGPLTLPNGRGGYLGDVLANVYSALGYAVTREYYINDRGNQIDVLGESVARRYLQSIGINVPYDDHLYQGDYITDLAKKLDLDDYAESNPKQMEIVKAKVKEQALTLMLDEIKRVVSDKMGIAFDSWFSEKSLYKQGVVKKGIDRLNHDGQTYQRDGATWLRTTAYGDDKDRVVVKASGEGAYIQGDIALFYNRAFQRKFRQVVLIVGADHHGYQKRLQALRPLFGTDMQFDLLFTQMATLTRDGKEVRISKRTGTIVTIEELIDEVGPDVARFFFLLYSSDSHMQFDLDLAKEQSSNNPVYYVQYAHARLCSILREVDGRGAPKKTGPVQVDNPAERDLVKTLIQFPDLLRRTADTYEAHHIALYAVALARAFHHFYVHCRVIDGDTVDPSRYQLVRATRIVLRNTLGILGVSAPELM